MKIALLSCTKKKQQYRCDARTMYSPSQLFFKAMNYVEKRNYDAWFVMSAKYGLLKPSEIIDPYNITLNGMSKNEIITWSQNVFKQLQKYPIVHIDFYAGINYRKHLIPLLEKHNIIYGIPLKGMGIGQQLKFYNEVDQ